MSIDLSQLTDKQKKKLQKLTKLMETGDVALLEHLFEMEEKMDEMMEKCMSEMEKVRNEAVPKLQDVLDQVKGAPGKDAYVPKKGIDYHDGIDGEDYIITERDKIEIAEEAA